MQSPRFLTRTPSILFQRLEVGPRDRGARLEPPVRRRLAGEEGRVEQDAACDAAVSQRVDAALWTAARRLDRFHRHAAVSAATSTAATDTPLKVRSRVVIVAPCPARHIERRRLYRPANGPEGPRQELWYDSQLMLALLRRVFGVYGHCLTGTLAAGVILLVTAVTVYEDLAVAVVVGVIVSALAYSWNNARRIHARTRESITDKGAKVYEIQGPLFFGSSGNWASTVMGTSGTAPPSKRSRIHLPRRIAWLSMASEWETNQDGWVRMPIRSSFGTLTSVRSRLPPVYLTAGIRTLLPSPLGKAI